VVDLDIVTLRYLELRAVLPQAEIFYAVKANPSREVIETLVPLGSSFDVASPAEIDLCLASGARPDMISYGNTIKRAADIAYAHSKGIRLFAFDSESELRKIAATAPGSSVFCRLSMSGGNAQWPLSRKFGCDPQMATDLLILARDLGLDPCGVSFHVGSQQLDTTSWDLGIRRAAQIFSELREAGIEPSLINLGGGFPASYSPDVPSIAEYAKNIDSSLRESLGDSTPRIIVEPGRFVVGDAGVMRSRVVLISRKSYADERRWVYLDVGRFGGLAETENESIRYPIVTGLSESNDVGPVTLAGPTCDSADIMYEKTPLYLPVGLEVGDYVDFLCAGAYTATYSSVAFNGFPPLPTYFFGDKQ
jgi:ornithine decarboxylase